MGRTWVGSGFDQLSCERSMNSVTVVRLRGNHCMLGLAGNILIDKTDSRWDAVLIASPTIFADNFGLQGVVIVLFQTFAPRKGCWIFYTFTASMYSGIMC